MLRARYPPPVAPGSLCAFAASRSTISPRIRVVRGLRSESRWDPGPELVRGPRGRRGDRAGGTVRAGLFVPDRLPPRRYRRALRPRRRGYAAPQEAAAAVPAPRKERRAVPPERGGRPARLRAGGVARAAAAVSRMEAQLIGGRWRGAAKLPCGRGSSGATMARDFSPSWATTLPAPGARASRPVTPVGRPPRWRAGSRRAGRRCCDPRSVPDRAVLQAVTVIPNSTRSGGVGFNPVDSLPSYWAGECSSSVV